MKDIIQVYLSQARFSGKTPFFEPQIAIQIISDCKMMNIPIHGIDAVKITENCTQPFMEYSADYSSKEKVWDEAIAFINKNEKLGLLFEVVIAE